MRELGRIPNIIDKLEAVWINKPDLRLGQLLVNMAPQRLNNDIYYWEDSDLEKQLDIIIENIINKEGK